jgi:hypothetical protein
VPPGVDQSVVSKKRWSQVASPGSAVAPLPPGKPAFDPASPHVAVVRWIWISCCAGFGGGEACEQWSLSVTFVIVEPPGIALRSNWTSARRNANPGARWESPT